MPCQEGDREAEGEDDDAKGRKGSSCDKVSNN